ncbi:MAG: hypothetical protein ACOYJZ_06265 [Acutalibacter sp.]|jgi:AcrR family transcriptional regulator
MPAQMKEKIADTYAQLLCGSSIDKITVKALIDACHISRQTFYYHFQDILDVLEYIIRRDSQGLVERASQAEDLTQVLRIYVSFAQERVHLLRRLLTSQHRARVEALLLEAAMDTLRQLSCRASQQLALTSAEEDVLLRFNAWGMMGVLMAYSDSPTLDQERLVHQLERIISGELSGWLKK